MTFSLSARSRSNMAGLHPDLVRIVEGAIVSTTVDFGVAAPAVRTAAQQHALFLQGVTQKDGYSRKSNHQTHDDGYGYAVDLTPYVSGKFVVTDDAWALYPHIASAMSKSAKALGSASRLRWGCNWSEPMSQYGSDYDDMKAAMQRYRDTHPGPDFLDGPHFELR